MCLSSQMSPNVDQPSDARSPPAAASSTLKIWSPLPLQHHLHHRSGHGLPPGHRGAVGQPGSHCARWVHLGRRARLCCHAQRAALGLQQSLCGASRSAGLAWTHRCSSHDALCGGSSGAPLLLSWRVRAPLLVQYHTSNTPPFARTPHNADGRAVARYYMSTDFWLDFIATVPSIVQIIIIAADIGVRGALLGMPAAPAPL